MGDEDYFDAFNNPGRLIDPQNFDQVRGKLDREYNDAAREELEQRYTVRRGPAFDPGPQGEGGGGGLGAVVIAVALVAAVVWLFAHLLPLIPDLAFASAFVLVAGWIGGAVVFWGTRLTPASSTPRPAWQRVTYRNARSAALAGIWRYVALGVGIRIVAALIASGKLPGGDVDQIWAEVWRMAFAAVRALPIDRDLAMLTASPRGQWLAIGGLILLMHGPGILACAFIVRGRFFGYYRGASGFVAACLTALVAIELGVFVALPVCGLIRGHVSVVPFTGDERLSILVVFSALIVVPCAVVGGVIGGILLLSATRALSGTRVSSYWRSYVTAVRALFVYGLLLVLAVYLFRDADEVLWRLTRWVFAGVGPGAVVSGGPIAASLVAMMVLHAPALLAAAAQVSRSEDAVYQGPLGFGKACAVAGVTCVAIWTSLWAIAVQGLPEIVTRLEAWLAR